MRIRFVVAIQNIDENEKNEEKKKIGKAKGKEMKKTLYWRVFSIKFAKARLR